MLAGRSLPLMLSSTALFATWFGSETVFGASSQFLEGGLFAVIEDPFGAVLCLVLFGAFFARKLYGMNLLTLGDYYKVRFGKRTELLASLFLSLPYTGYIAAQLVAMGIILQVVTGMDLWQGVVLSSGVVTLYTFIGGMWAISVTDFVQTIIIIAGLLVLSVMLATEAGGVSNVLAGVPRETFRFFPSFNIKDIAAWIAAWSVLGLGSIPSQDVFQRSMSSKSADTAVRSFYIAGVLYLTIALLPLFISLCTKHLYGNELVEDAQLALPMMVIRHTPLFVQILFFGSLLSAVMSTTSAAILAPAAVFSENLLKPLAGNRFTDKQLLVVTKLSVVLFSVTATIMACMRSNIYELVGESSIATLVSLFAPLVLGLYWKRANAAGALCSILLGIISWIIFEFIYLIEWPALIPATIISFAAMVVGSMAWPNTLTENDKN